MAPQCYCVPDAGTHPFSMPARFIPTVLPSDHTLRLRRRMEIRMGKGSPCLDWVLEREDGRLSSEPSL